MRPPEKLWRVIGTRISTHKTISALGYQLNQLSSIATPATLHCSLGKKNLLCQLTRSAMYFATVGNRNLSCLEWVRDSWPNALYGVDGI